MRLLIPKPLDSRPIDSSSQTSIQSPQLVLIDVGEWKGLRFQRAIKRAFDVILSALLLTLLSPLIVLSMVAVRLTSAGSPLFVHRRLGAGERTFPLYKIRTMTDGAALMQPRLVPEPHEGIFLKIEDDPRVTPIGRLLRKTSIDELPQLFNVLRGDMSLIGPRPLVASEVERLSPADRLRRASVRPGITGLWQVSGRNDCRDEERLELDLAYVDRWSLGMDLMVLLRTFPAVLSGRGAR